MHCHVVNRLSRAWTASSTDSEGDLLESAAQFDRSQPVVLLAGAAVVGFALSRLIKAAATRGGQPDVGGAS